MSLSNTMWTFLVGDEGLMNYYQDHFQSPWAIGVDAWYGSREDANSAAWAYGSSPSRMIRATHALLIRCVNMREVPANPPNIPIDMYQGDVEEKEVVSLTA